MVAKETPAGSAGLGLFGDVGMMPAEFRGQKRALADAGLPAAQSRQHRYGRKYACGR